MYWTQSKQGGFFDRVLQSGGRGFRFQAQSLGSFSASLPKIQNRQPTGPPKSGTKEEGPHFPAQPDWMLGVRRFITSTVDYVYDLRDSITRGSDMVYIQSKFAISSAIEDRDREARASRISPKALSGVEGHLISPHCLLSHSPLHQSPDIIFNDLNILLVRRIDHPKRPLVLKGVWILKAVRFFSFSSKPLRMSERDSPPGTRKDW